MSQIRNGNDGEEGFAPRLNDVSKKFLSECVAEKERLGDNFPLASMLIDEAFDKVQSTGRIPGRDMYADVFKQKPMKISQKVFVPVKQFPKFNFNGKILGPKGNSLRRLQEDTMCKIGIKGRNSMRDPVKEEELRQSGDPRHAHLNKDLYVEISTVAVPAEGYARIAYALAEIRKYLIPDKNDEVSQNQLKEILADPESAPKAAKFVARVNGSRGPFNGGMERKGAVSILQKITGQSLNGNKDYSDDYDDDQSAYMPMRQSSQRPPMKRPPPQSAQTPQQQRYLNPQKRLRETHNGGPIKPSFPFFQKYQ